MVREPASFDEVVAPGGGGPIQAAIDRCRKGGSILLQPGTYNLSEAVRISKELHVFGRGLARLRAIQCNGVSCSAAAATLDGLVVERTRGSAEFIGVSLTGGRARLQNSVVTGAFELGVAVGRGADPVIVSCR